MNTNLSPFDWALIVFYLVATIGISVYSRLRSRKDTTEYLAAGRSMNWIVVAIAVFATLFSTISFVSTPGEAYNYGCFLFICTIGEMAAMPLAIWLFLRFFFIVPTFTAYEYLERRYNPAVRICGAVLFLTTRLIYTGGVFYAASVIFQRLMGWEPAWTVLIIGTITVGYTVTGGIKGVIWADVVQSVLIFVGIAAITWKLLDVIGYSPWNVLKFAHEHDHTFELLFKPEFYRLETGDRWNIYVVIPNIIMSAFIMMSCDQLVIQRLLTSRNYRSAKRSVFSNYIMGIPVSIALFMIGLSLFYYYNTNGNALPEGVPGDQALGYFIATELPAPIPGVIVVALLSALMSTVAGVVNSLGTVCYNDILLKIKPSIANSGKELKWCYLLSLLAGVLGVGWAFFLVVAAQGVKTTLQDVVSVWGGLWSLLVAAFLYAVGSKRVSSKSILITFAIVGVWQLVFPYIMYFRMPEGQRWGLWWLGIPGIIASLVLPPLLSLIWPHRRDLTNLTLWTLDEEHRKMLAEKTK